MTISGGVPFFARSPNLAPLLAADRHYLSILLGSQVKLYSPLDLQSVPTYPPIRFPDIGAVLERARLSPVVLHFLEVLRAESFLVGAPSIGRAATGSSSRSAVSAM